YLKHDPKDTDTGRAVEQSLAYALESVHDFAGAEPYYRELAENAPDRGMAADFYMAAARCLRAQSGHGAQALAIYGKVATEFKDTPAARDAEVAVGELTAQGS